MLHTLMGTTGTRRITITSTVTPMVTAMDITLTDTINKLLLGGVTTGGGNTRSMNMEKSREEKDQADGRKKITISYGDHYDSIPF